MGVFDILFPTNCLECGIKGNYLCARCLSKVPPAKLFCLRCKKKSIDGLTHAKCITNHSPEFAYSPWSYDGAVRSALLRLKYNFVREVSQELGKKYCLAILRTKLFRGQKAYITVVPLNRSRYNWRGYNQSLELCKAISLEFGWKLLPDVLLRKKAGKHQAELKGKERVHNIKGAFGFNMKYKKLANDKKPVIIFNNANLVIKYIQN